MNGNAIPWRIFFYRIPLPRRMKNRIPQGWMIQQCRTLKSKLPRYRLKKKAQYRNIVNPHVPLAPHQGTGFFLGEALRDSKA